MGLALRGSRRRSTLPSIACMWPTSRTGEDRRNTGRLDSQNDIGFTFKSLAMYEQGMSPDASSVDNSSQHFAERNFSKQLHYYPGHYRTEVPAPRVINIYGVQH